MHVLTQDLSLKAAGGIGWHTGMRSACTL
jgi:hypothetical protein